MHVRYYDIYIYVYIYVSLSPGFGCVSVRRSLLVSVHVYGRSGSRNIRRIFIGPSSSISKRGATSVKVQSLLFTERPGQHFAHDGDPTHDERCRGSEGWQNGRESRFGCPWLWGHQPLVGFSITVTKNLRGKRFQQWVTEYPASGQWTRCHARPTTQRVPVTGSRKIRTLIQIAYDDSPVNKTESWDLNALW